jgi:hypothetical protein
MLLGPTTALQLQHGSERLHSLKRRAPPEFLADEEVGALPSITDRPTAYRRRLSADMIWALCAGRSLRGMPV